MAKQDGHAPEPADRRSRLDTPAGRLVAALGTIALTTIGAVAYFEFTPSTWAGHFAPGGLPIIDLVALWTGSVVVWFFPMYDFVDKETSHAIKRLKRYQAIGGELPGNGFERQRAVLEFFASPLQRFAVRYMGGAVGIIPGVGFTFIALGDVSLGTFLLVFVLALAVLVSMVEATAFVVVFSLHAPGQQYMTDLLGHLPPPSGSKGTKSDLDGNRASGR